MNRGFSMIEVIISMGLLTGLAVMGMQFMKNQSESQKTVEKKYETVTVVSSIRSLLSEPDNCTHSFKGQSATMFVPTKLYKKVGLGFEEVYVRGTQLPGNIKIDNYLLNKTYPGLASNESVLRINFNLGKEAIRDTSQGILRIHYSLDPDTGLIATCYALNNNSDNLWEKSIIDHHNIFYNSGNVGIGTTTPTAKLTVAGSIKVGESALCNPMTEGELRYDSVSHAMAFCNGAVWIPMGGALTKMIPVDLSCDDGAISYTTIACTPGTFVRSCGLTLLTPSIDQDGLTCTIDPSANACIGMRNKIGTCDAGIKLECFCQ